MIETHDTLQINLGGANEVDVETLTIILENTIKTLKKISQYTDEDNFQKFVVKDIKKGSFIIELIAVASLNAPLITQAASAISIFKNILEIKKFLNGEKAKEVIRENSGVIIVNGSDNRFRVDNLTINVYTENQDIEDNINRIAKRLYQDENRTDMTLTINKSDSNLPEKLVLGKADSDIISRPVDLKQFNPQLKTDVITQMIIVGKPDFVADTKWTIYVNGNKESAKMNDLNFIANISNFRFTKGTKMLVELQVTYHVDSDGIPVQNKKVEYNILQVIDVYNDN